MFASLPRSILALVLPFAALSAAHAQSRHPFDIGASYTYVRTNLVPGCMCFGLQGGGVQAQYGLTSHVFLAADATFTHASNITPDHYALTHITYTFGPRVLLTRPTSRLRPFAEFKLGAATAAGSLSPSNTFGSAATVFALETGGGLAVRLRRRLDLLPIQADYLHTRFANTESNGQNDLRLSAGLLFHLR